jgi:transglutaminase-like putative cysteine protease
MDSWLFDLKTRRTRVAGLSLMHFGRELAVNHGTTTSSTSRPIDRRTLLKGSAGVAAATLGAGVLGGRVAGQIDSTPPPVPTTTAPPVDPIPDLAAQLGYDREANFAFVRDEIHYESYAGVLRGAKGTLWARAGNSADQAMLLAALLDASQLPYRFAVGSLSEEAQEELVSLTNASRERAQAAFDARTAASYGFDPAADLPPEPVLTPEVQSLLDEATALAESSRATTAEWFDSTASTIRDALDAAGVILPEPGSPIPQMELDQHVWVQTPDGPDWATLDPTFPAETTTGERATVAQTVAELPPEMSHIVRFRVVAEEVQSGAPYRRDAVTKEFTSSDLINLPVSFMVIPTEGLEALGQSLNRLFDAGMSFNPAIVFGTDEEAASTPVVFDSQEDSVLGLFDEGSADEGAPGEGETIALWYGVDVMSPGLAPVTVERPWFDRFTAEQRLAEELDLTQMAPVQLFTRSDGSVTIAGLDTMTIVGVEVARLPLQIAFSDPELTDLLAGTNTMGPTFSALRDALGIDLEWNRGFSSWVASPQITGFTFKPEDPLDEESPLILEMDLLVHGPATAPFPASEGTPAAGASIHPAMAAGIIDQLAERLMLDPDVWSLDSEQEGKRRASIHVGRVFDEAVAASIPIWAMVPGDDTSGLDLPAASVAAIQQSLDLGLVVVSPEQSVEIDGEARTGWWVIDPVTGTTRDQMDSGGGSVSARTPLRGSALGGPIVEYIVTWATAWWERVVAYKCLAAIVAVVVGSVVVAHLEPGPTTAWVKLGAASAASAGLIGGCSLTAGA